ncbi:hypothetical protein EDB81DRAFT_807663 [Dactylonectria macrodidyma]|uniref:Uncharacterized protein n=1 Tax=Dactylonectria macrodidyma TaxID=307937 RepID=A0A9P9E247_9HYPO|nr:hypothetical protein EDB81DRAFT_807663 [Dactylonectria macrodidyma]
MGHERVILGESERASATRPAPLAIFPHEPLQPGIVSSIDKNRDGGFYGPFEAHLLATQAASLISSNSDANEELLTQALHRFLALAWEDYTGGVATTNSKVQKAHSCWLCIRMTLPTDSWVVPRWHTDGRMFDCACSEPKLPHSKYAFTILGPSTRVMATNPAVNAVLETLSETGEPWDQNGPDPGLAKKLAEYPEDAVELGQIIRFSWGQHDSPVHSEPDSTGLHRVFVSLLFGSEEEIRSMCEIRDENYGSWN